MMYEHSQLQDVKRHPIRGAFWGLLLGIGAALFLIGQKIIAFGTLPPLLVIGAGLVLGVLWSLFAPAKELSGAPPPPQRQAYVAEEVRLDPPWEVDPASASEGHYGVPVGDHAVPGGEYADPVHHDEPMGEHERSGSTMPTDSVPGSRMPPPPPPAAFEPDPPQRPPLPPPAP